LSIGITHPEGTKSSSTRLRKVTSEEWYSRLPEFDDASIYQTRAYGSCHWSPEQLSTVVLEDNSQTLAMAQLRVVRVPLLQTGIAYLRWGPLCRRKGQPFDADLLERVLSALQEEFVHRRGLLLRVLPPVFETDSWAGAFKSTGQALGFRRIEQARVFRTIRLDLSGSLESLRKGLDGKWRNMLNGAERNGLTISEGADPDFYEQFVAAYREMMARKQFDTTVDVAEFGHMQRELPEPFKMQVFLWLKDGRVLNALVLSAIGDTGIYLLGATRDEGLKLKGAYLLQWRAIQWLKARGCRWYDLGGIDATRNPGVYHFKQGFGGEETEHLGTFESGAGLASELCVKTGERLQALIRRFRSGSDSRLPAGAKCGAVYASPSGKQNRRFDSFRYAS